VNQPMKAISRTELEAAFPWVCHLPSAAIGEFLAAIEIYRDAAEIYRAETYPEYAQAGEAAASACGSRCWPGTSRTGRDPGGSQRGRRGH
jgi:hypothetical protein